MSSSHPGDTKFTPSQQDTTTDGANASSSTSRNRPQTPYNLSTTSGPTSPASQYSASPASVFSRSATSPATTRPSQHRPYDHGRTASIATAITEPDVDPQLAAHQTNIQDLVNQGHFNPHNEEEEVQDEIGDFVDDMFPEGQDEEGGQDGGGGTTA
ncbi:hypothetical protein L202_03071 [Cryptococcus amylolentus CBS 6039]|uniref:Uncharacterized protein n=2 Tax=Cryptococcus amylolentus TaxID=104669 RepID=A0A1E3HXA7_9TREE|nr:hypothetical protein L202_03071 [Cryptococcus amylolentus CBS 6039]ODN80958.1 hypothetical protein L202_03071 [Cryptococcus amylolentus CBS 6039]ODO09440.1 hypothetical protein I350_03040 [Cryptococcus amylolentus CBS 6273]